MDQSSVATVSMHGLMTQWSRHYDVCTRAIFCIIRGHQYAFRRILISYCMCFSLKSVTCTCSSHVAYEHHRQGVPCRVYHTQVVISLHLWESFAQTLHIFATVLLVLSVSDCIQFTDTCTCAHCYAGYTSIECMHYTLHIAVHDVWHYQPSSDRTRRSNSRTSRHTTCAELQRYRFRYSYRFYFHYRIIRSTPLTYLTTI